MKTRLILLACAGLLAACATTTADDRDSATHVAAMPDTADDRITMNEMEGDLPPIGAPEEVEEVEVRRPITGTCGMEDLQHFVGQPRVNMPQSAVPGTYRVLGPDSITTMEYRADRVTIRVDAEDRIESIACG